MEALDHHIRAFPQRGNGELSFSKGKMRAVGFVHDQRNPGPVSDSGNSLNIRHNSLIGRRRKKNGLDPLFLPGAPTIKQRPFHRLRVDPAMDPIFR